MCVCCGCVVPIFTREINPMLDLVIHPGRILLLLSSPVWQGEIISEESAQPPGAGAGMLPNPALSHSHTGLPADEKTCRAERTCPHTHGCDRHASIPQTTSHVPLPAKTSPASTVSRDQPSAKTIRLGVGTVPVPGSQPRRPALVENLWIDMGDDSILNPQTIFCVCDLDHHHYGTYRRRRHDKSSCFVCQIRISIFRALHNHRPLSRGSVLSWFF